MMRKTKIVFILFMLLLSTRLVGCSNEVIVEEKNPTSVKTIQVNPSTIVNSIELAGEVSSDKEVVISTKIPGKISRILVSVGKEVKQGDILFELENRDLKATVKQAKHSLEIAEANLERVMNGARAQEVEQANQRVNQAKIQLDLATSNFERMKNLYEVDAISRQQYDQALSQLQLAESSYKSTLEQQSLIIEGASDDMIKAARAQVNLAKANLEMANSKLNDTIISAPLSGKIAFVNFEIGEFVTQGSPIIQIVDDENMKVNIAVSEQYIPKLKLGDRVKVNISATTNELYDGEVTEISPVADKKAKVYPIEISIENEQGELKSGMTARVIIELEKKENIITIPINSYLEELGEKYVFVIENNRAVRKNIKLGINDGKLVEVIEGLNNGEHLIIKGQNQIKDGEQITEGREL